MTSRPTPSNTSRPLAVHSVHEFVFSIPDLEAACHFYTSFAQDVRNENGGLAPYTRGTPIAGRGYAMARAGV
jgi:hypothetical protein